MKYRSVEEMIIGRISENRGAKNFINKSTLIAIAKENGIDVTDNPIKKDIAEKIAEVIGYSELAIRANVGVSSKELQDKFGITNDDVKRMAKNEFFTIVGKESFQMYGKTRYANLYSPYDYFKSKEEVDNWISEHPKRRSHRKE